MRVVHGRCRALAVFAAALAAVFASAEDARSRPLDAATRACVDAYGSAQEHRLHDDLIGARGKLRVCAASTCPRVVTADCTKWLDEVVEAIPSVVLGAKLGDDSVLDVRVELDGRPLVDSLDGRAIELNPGLHTFRFERAGSPSLEKKVIVAAHQKSQMVSVAWEARAARKSDAAAGAADSAGSPSRPVPGAVYVLGAAAAVGFGAFAVLGLSGRDVQQRLESSCSPSCKPGDVDDLRARYLGADIAAGVGALSAAGALLLFLTRPEAAKEREAASSIGIVTTGGGAGVEWKGSF